MLSQKLAVVMVGLPGAGKDTVIEETIGIINGHHIGTGKYFRDVAPEITRMGRLAPDELANEFVAREIVKNHSSTVVLNGYPRNENQARVALKMLTGTSHRILVIELQIPEELSIERQLQRYEKMKKEALTDPSIKVRPEDGDLDVVKHRTLSQFEDIQEVLHFMVSRANFVRLMATRPVEEVADSFLRTVLDEQKAMGLRTEHSATKISSFTLDNFALSS